MSKNKKSKQTKQQITEVKTTSDASIVATENDKVVANVPANDNEQKVVKADKNGQKKLDKNAKDKKNKKKQPKEKGKLKRKTKETLSELKKVTWPTFGEVCKRTGVVLVVVLIFAVVVFGIDYCLGLLVNLLKK